MKKTVVALVLVLALLTAVFPYGAFAAEDGITVKEVNNKYIYGVPERTTLAAFNRAYARTGFIMIGLEGGVVPEGSSAFLGTGFKVRYESSIGEYTTLTLIVLGDIDGNGRVTSGDYLNIRAHLKGTAALTEIKKLAADVNGDNAISTFDYLLVKSHFLGTYDIYKDQKLPDNSSEDTSVGDTSDPWTSGWA